MYIMVIYQLREPTSPEPANPNPTERIKIMFQEIIVLTVAYVVLIGCLYAPRCPKTVSPDSPVGAVQYFPEIDDQPVTPSPAPDSPVVENPTPESAIATVAPLETLPSNELKVIATVTTSPVNLENLTSKELKRSARELKIPKYGSLSKKALILALT